jgi:hypothetical protein
MEEVEVFLQNGVESLRTSHSESREQEQFAPWQAHVLIQEEFVQENKQDL